MERYQKFSRLSLHSRISLLDTRTGASVTVERRGYVQSTNQATDLLTGEVAKLQALLDSFESAEADGGEEDGRAETSD